MGCKIYILTKADFDANQDSADSSGEGKNAPKGIFIGEVGRAKSAADVTYDDIVRIITGMSQGERQLLAGVYTSAETFTMSERDLKNMDIVSNITYEGLFSRLNLNPKWYGDAMKPDLYEGYVLLNCAKMNVARNEFSGIYVNDKGTKVVILKGKDDAKRFVNYILAKKSLSSSDTVQNLNPKSKFLTKYEYDNLDKIVKKYYTDKGKAMPDYQTMLYDFVENAQTFDGSMDLLDKNGKTVRKNVVNYLNSVVKEFSKDYFIRQVANMNDMETAIYMSLEDKSDPYMWKIDKAKLYDIVTEYRPEVLKALAERFYPENNGEINKMEFVNMNEEEIDRLLKGDIGVRGLFDGCETLGNMLSYAVTRPKLVKEGETTVVGQSKKQVTEFVKSKWGELVGTLRKNDKFRKEYEEYDSFKKLDADEMAKQFNKKKFTADIDGQTRELKAETYIKTNKEGVEKKYVKYYYTVDKMQTIETDYGKSTVMMKIEDMSLGRMFNFKYGDKYPLKAVDCVDVGEYGEIYDGQYHGMYVYSYYDPDTQETKYVTTRSVMSPEEGGRRYSELEDALRGIDRQNMYEKLSDNALVSIKSQDRDFFEIRLEGSKFQKGQLLSVLDYDLEGVDYSNIFPAFRRLLEMSGSKFHEYFDEELGTSSLYTPEMCATYLIEQYKDLFQEQGKMQTDNTSDIIDYIKENHNNNIEKWSEIISKISDAGRRHYYLKEVNPTNKKDLFIGKLFEIYDQGVTVDLTGQYVGSKPLWQILQQTMRKAGEWLEENYSTTIRFMTSAEMLNAPELQDIGFNEENIKSVNAFVHKGVAYVNITNGNEQDLFQEIAHMMLGVVKNNSYEEYDKLLKYYSKNRSFRYEMKKVNNDPFYSDYALEDREEEALARFIAKTIYNDVGLRNYYELPEGETTKSIDNLVSRAGFNSKAFTEAMEFILNVLKTMHKNTVTNTAEVGEKDPAEFTVWLKEQTMKDGVRDRRIVSNLVKDLISKGKIERPVGC